MIRVEIKDLPYLPVNRAKMLARNMLIKTPLCREFEKDLSNRLLEFSKDFEEFRNSMHKGNNFISIKYILFCPRSEFFTKSGEISSRCPDADSIKVFQDTLFKSLQIDDKFIKELLVQMRPSSNEHWNYVICISHYPLEALYV